MAGRWIRGGRLGLFFLSMVVLIVGCGVESPAAAPPTPTPGATFLMPTPAPPVSAPPYTPTPEMFLYIVQEGDTLYDIALRYDVSVDDLVEVNNLKDPHSLSVGQELFIPLPVEPTPTSTPSS